MTPASQKQLEKTNEDSSPLDSFLQSVDQQRDQIYEQGREKVEQALNLDEKEREKLRKKRAAKRRRRRKKREFIENAYRKNSNSFAGGFNFYKLFWIFSQAALSALYWRWDSALLPKDM